MNAKHEYLCYRCNSKLEECEIELGGRIDECSNDIIPTPKFKIKGYKCPNCEKKLES